mmetsp:Transcript_5536/g.16826  ORF Transcript_5536/g.16826 Transcript_5536/m.16826 type:complete len:369 (+) Transcript_5536:693-1799(+)
MRQQGAAWQRRRGSKVPPQHGAYRSHGQQRMRFAAWVPSFQGVKGAVRLLDSPAAAPGRRTASPWHCQRRPTFTDETRGRSVKHAGMPLMRMAPRRRCICPPTGPSLHASSPSPPHTSAGRADHKHSVKLGPQVARLRRAAARQGHDRKLAVWRLSPPAGRADHERSVQVRPQVAVLLVLCMQPHGRNVDPEPAPTRLTCRLIAVVHHHLLEALEVTHGQQQVKHLHHQLVLARVQHRHEFSHGEARHGGRQLGFYTALHQRRVAREDVGVHELVLFGVLKLPAVSAAERLALLLKVRVHQDVLETPDDAVKLVGLGVVRAAVVYNVNVLVLVLCKPEQTGRYGVLDSGRWALMLCRNPAVNRARNRD